MKNTKSTAVILLVQLETAAGVKQQTLQYIHLCFWSFSYLTSWTSYLMTFLKMYQPSK